MGLLDGILWAADLSAPPEPTCGHMLAALVRPCPTCADRRSDGPTTEPAPAPDVVQWSGGPTTEPVAWHEICMSDGGAVVGPSDHPATDPLSAADPFDGLGVEPDIGPDEAARLLMLLDADACRASLPEFVRLAWPIIMPSTPLEWGPHLDAICWHIQGQLEDLEAKRRDPAHVMRAQNLLVNCPPRSLKTVLLTLANAWAWTRCPWLQVLYLSANPRVVLDSARMFRNVVSSPWYQDHFVQGAWKIRDDQDALSSIGNTAGGARRSVGFQAELIGANCIARGSVIATEIGDVPIEQLGDLRTPPRVWSRGVDGQLELRRVLAWKHKGAAQIVNVRISDGHVLRCTDEHRVWTPEGYQEAKNLTGRRVSVVRWADSVPQGRLNPVRGLLAGDADVRDVLEDLPEGRGRARQDGASGYDPDVLLGRLYSREAARVGASVQTVQLGLHAELDQGQSAVLLEGLLPRARRRSAEAPGQALPGVRAGVPAEGGAAGSMLASVRRPGPGPSHGGYWELEPSRARPGARDSRELLRHDILVEDLGGDQGARFDVRGVQRADERRRASTGGTSHRPGRAPQPAREPDLAVRRVPRIAPQQLAAVLSVDVAPECAGGGAVDVYDIEVEGNHNFFADGVLVHNCDWLNVDDAHSMDDSDDKIEAAIENYDGNISSRMNDPRWGIRTGIMQRARKRDFSDHVLGQGWFHLRMPMEYETRPECRCAQCAAGALGQKNAFGWVDWRTADGQILHERFTPEYLAERMKVLRPHGYAGQMQQRPSAKEGNQFKVGLWRYHQINGDGRPRARPAGAHEGEAIVLGHRPDGSLDVDWVCLSVDPTGGSTSETASALGMAAIAGRGQRRHVLEDLTPGPQTWAQTVKALPAALARTSDVTGWTSRILVLVEKKALGVGAMSDLEEAIAGGRVKNSAGQTVIARVEPYEPSGKGSKENRSEFLEPMQEAGLLTLADGAVWLHQPPHGSDQTWVDEFAAFPKGHRDDRVDLLAQCCDHYREEVPDWVRYFKEGAQREAEARAAGAIRNLTPATNPRKCEGRWVDGICQCALCAEERAVVDLEVTPLHHRPECACDLSGYVVPLATDAGVCGHCGGLRTDVTTS